MNQSASQTSSAPAAIRLRLGFFSYLEGTEPQAEVYARTMELFQAADDLGFDVAWVAQHHFGHHGGLPSPFVFFASLAERTRQIGVGTAIVTLPLENPVRVAENAAVFEALYPGRLQLGVGTGFASPQVMATFERDGQDRRQLYDRGITTLLSALAGDQIDADGDVLNPPAPALLERIWEAPSTPERAIEAGRRGSGLLLSRVVIGAGNRHSYELQKPLVEAYIASLPADRAPRIGLSRTVYPTLHPDIALRDLEAGLEEMERTAGNNHSFPKDGGPRGLFAHHNIHTGGAEDVSASLRDEPLIAQTTDLICQVQPGLPSHAQTLEALELIATQVAPAFGWRPRQAKLPLS